MEERQRADMAITMLDTNARSASRPATAAIWAHLRIKSPIGGMVVLQTSSRRGELTQIRVGDLVASGQPVMQVVDPDSMQLARMMIRRGELVRLGQSATLRFDAFPDIVLSGDVQYGGQWRSAESASTTSSAGSRSAIQETRGDSDLPADIGWTVGIALEGLGWVRRSGGTGS